MDVFVLNIWSLVKTMMSGPIVCLICVGKYREKKHTKIHEDKYFCFLHRQFITLVKDSRHSWSFYGRNIG